MNTPHTTSSTPDTPNTEHPHRRTKGTGIPATVWFDRDWAPDDDEQLDREHAGRVLPDWAVDRLLEEYRPDDHAVAYAAYAPAPTYGEYGCDRSAHHDIEGPETVGLAVIEFHPPHTAEEFRARNLDPRQTDAPGEYLRSALAETHNILIRNGIAAVALSHSRGTRFTDRTGEVIAAARAAGFAYLQHLVVIDAPVAGDAIPVPPRAAWPAKIAVESAGTRVHARVHHDVLIFTRTSKGAAA